MYRTWASLLSVIAATRAQPVGDTKQTCCLVSGAHGFGDSSLWTCMTNDSLIDDGLTTGEPQASRRRAPTGALVAQSGRISRTLTMVVVSMTMEEEESAHGAEETLACGWNESATSKIHNPLTRPSKGCLVSVPPASTSHEGDGLAFQEEGTATRIEGHEAKSRVIASTTRTCHLDGYTSADAG